MRRFVLLVTSLIFNFHLIAQTNIQLVLQTEKHIDSIDVFDESQVEFYTFPFNDTLNIHFNKTNKDCYWIRYHENQKMYRQTLWLDTGNIIVLTHIDTTTLVIDTVIDSPFYYEVIKFNSDNQSLFKRGDTSRLNSFLEEAITKNINNPLSLAIANGYLQLNQNSKSNLLTLKTLLAKQGDKFKWFSLYLAVHERLNNILNVKTINLSDFLFADKYNKAAHLHLKGAEYYVLDFWFLDCAPCRQDHKEIKSALQKFLQKKISIISISTDEDFDSWKNYLIKNIYTWANFREEKNKKITDSLKISTYPTYIVLNNKAEIIKTYNSIAAVEDDFKLNE